MRDIEDKRGVKPLVFKIKGTTVGRFPAIEFTAALLVRERYHLVLVTECESGSPKIEVVQDPWGLANAGRVVVTPMSFRIELVMQAAQNRMEATPDESAVVQ